LLDVLTEHLAAAGATARGGLLAVELHDADRLRALGDLTAFDELLTQVGEFIVAQVVAGSMTARYGKAGFVVFAPSLEREELTALATGLIGAAADRRFGTRAWVVQLHAGVCAFGSVIRESAVALAGLEQALGKARAGPGRVAVHGDADSASDKINVRIAAALATGSFNLAFQSVLPIRGASDPLYQALLRLRSDGREYLAAELVPAAVRAGTIGAVDAWVVERSIGILALRQQAGEPVCLIVSQSLEGWDDAARPAALSSQLSAAGVAADRLVLEFRCDAVRGNRRALTDRVRALQPAGVRFCLAGVDRDPWAAGWIAQLPFAYVKIRADLPDAELPEIVHAAHARGTHVIAPRIETVTRAGRLREAGVDLLQGNYFQPPGAEMQSANAQEMV
jgi:EAL domain-containing protein (putative c-di-GMP-specific phosphodiesterase class I)